MQSFEEFPFKMRDTWGCDRMVGGFRSTYAIRAYHH